ncbi:MAG TPA: nuclear transport factor 2 family protein [Caulobacteraceae bacterium]
MKVLIAALALVFATPALAHDPTAVAEEVRQADVAFAQRAQVVPIAQAFAEFMDAKEGMMFSGPVIGREAIFEAMGGAAPSPVVLEWVPTQWWGSKGGDMGVTTGDWRRTYKDGRPVRTGRYVTVWRKNANGEWKGLVDFGEPDETAKSNAVGDLPTP